jgi:hypothetical protein
LNNHPKINAAKWCKENDIETGDILVSEYWKLPRKVTVISKGWVEVRNVREDGTVFQQMWPRTFPADVRRRDDAA